MLKQHANAASLSKPTTINFPKPSGKKYLPFQIDGIKWLTSRYHSLLADDMGLGKTIQAIGAINLLGLKKVLIVCPASVKLNWKRELAEWLVDKSLTVEVVNGRTYNIQGCSVIIVNYDIVHHSNIINQLALYKFQALICDEAHFLKNAKAARTKAILSRKGIANNCLFKWMLTGTPILNRPIELYPMLRTLSVDTITPYSDYRSFAMRFCGGYQQGFALIANGATHCEELNTRLKKKFMLRRLSSEVLDQLPEVRNQIIFIEPKGVKAKLKVVDNADRLTFKHRDHGLDIGELATYRRELAEKKLEYSIDHIKEMIDQTGKVVIFTYHRSVLRKLRRELLEYGPFVVEGGMTSAGKQASINLFQNLDNSKVFIGQIQTAGQGIDGLQKVCSHVIFLEWTWVPGEVSQAIKRVHRYGQTKPVLVQFMVWEESVEEHMMRTALDKLKNIRKMVN